MAETGKDSFWKRIRRPYLLRLMDESTWKSVLDFHLTWLGAITLATLMFLLTVALLSLLIVYTPIRTILPGYTENIRQQLVEESVKIDSLDTELELHHRYLEMVRQVVAGEVVMDTIESIDSLQTVMRDQLLAAKSEAAEEFIAQYEAKGKDNYQLFNIQESQPIVTLFRPAHGIITEHFSSDDNRHGILMRVASNEPICSVLAGVVVYVNYELDNTYTVIVQHASYVSIYRHVAGPVRRVGEAIQAGEQIAMASDLGELAFELWQNGKNINPEEVIVF